MITKTYNTREIKKLISQKPVCESCNVFKAGLGIEKIYKDILFDLQRFYHMMTPFSLVDEEQIRWLSSNQPNVKKSFLPYGIINYENKSIGVMYPKYFENYKSFNELYTEDTNLFFENFRKSIENNIELMNNGIYNYDFTMGNILYKQNDVQLIDLDGKYISHIEDYHKVYTYYIVGMLNQIIKKIEMQYTGLERQSALNELRKIISKIPSNPMNIDYPIKLIDAVEEIQILKR